MAIPPPKRKKVSDADRRRKATIDRIAKEAASPSIRKEIARITKSAAHKKKIDKWDKQITEALRLLKNPPIAARQPNQRVPEKVRKWASLTKLIDKNYPVRGKKGRKRK
jgi:hypothetical protein